MWQGIWKGMPEGMLVSVVHAVFAADVSSCVALLRLRPGACRCVLLMLAAFDVCCSMPLRGSWGCVPLRVGCCCLVSAAC